MGSRAGRMNAVNLEDKLSTFSGLYRVAWSTVLADDEAHLLLIEPTVTPKIGDSATGRAAVVI